jgi:hypothetical protein
LDEHEADDGEEGYRKRATQAFTQPRRNGVSDALAEPPNLGESVTESVGRVYTRRVATALLAHPRVMTQRLRW